MERTPTEEYKVFIAADPTHKTFLDGYLGCLSLQNRLNHHGPEKVMMGTIREIPHGGLGFLLQRTAPLDSELVSFFIAVSNSNKFRSKRLQDSILIYDCLAREYDNTKETEMLLRSLGNNLSCSGMVLAYKANKGVLTTETKTSREELEEKLEYPLY